MDELVLGHRKVVEVMIIIAMGAEEVIEGAVVVKVEVRMPKYVIGDAIFATYWLDATWETS